jgi:hypothetical protein
VPPQDFVAEGSGCDCDLGTRRSREHSAAMAGALFALAIFVERRTRRDRA